MKYLPAYVRIKSYRWFELHQYARPDNSWAPRAKISKSFALMPKQIDGKWRWLKSYYSLSVITSAINFGGTTNLSYGIALRSHSMFRFKSLLKEQGIIKNLNLKNDWTKLPPEELNDLQKKLLKLLPNGNR